MIERHRHATVGRVRRRQGGIEHAVTQSRVVRRRGGLRDLYSADTAEARGGGRFRWFFSTCLAAAVGSVAIVAALFGASDPNDGRSGGGIARLRTISSSVQIEPPPPAPIAHDGLAWATPKSDRLEATTGAMVTRYIVQDSIRQRRGTREYIQNKPYARVLARLVAVRADAVGAVPAFNPIRLYGNATPIGESDELPEQVAPMPTASPNAWWSSSAAFCRPRMARSSMRAK